MVRELICFVAVAAFGLAASRFDGVWEGTFNSQPTELKPNGSYPEHMNRFGLTLHETRRIVTGEFRAGRQAMPIINGKLFGSRACFDVVMEGDDMRWCIEARGGRLEGMWSRGPEGGPLLDGAGAGARLFQISGHRAKPAQ